MLDAFLNLKYPKDNKWFDGLNISGYERCQRHRNAYPVINFDFKGLDVSSYEGFINDIKSRLSKLYREFEYLMDSPTLHRMDVKTFLSFYKCTMNNYDVHWALYNLSSMLCKHHGKKVVILLDGYDDPVNNSFSKPFQHDILDAIRHMLSPALKGNEYLDFGVITGVMKFSGESIFSGLNNLWVNNIFSKDFDESFGFTDDEIKRICEDNGHSEKYAEAKEWYGGYRFGEKDICNPRGLLTYVNEGFKPGPYWAGTSYNDIMNSLLDNLDDYRFRELQDLANGKGLIKSIDPHVALSDLKNNRNGVYSAMVMSGYLSAIPYDDDLYELRLPNGEMRKVFSMMIENHLEEMTSDVNSKLGNCHPV